MSGPDFHRMLGQYYNTVFTIGSSLKQASKYHKVPKHWQDFEKFESFFAADSSSSNDFPKERLEASFRSVLSRSFSNFSIQSERRLNYLRTLGRSMGWWRTSGKNIETEIRNSQAKLTNSRSEVLAVINLGFLTNSLASGSTVKEKIEEYATDSRVHEELLDELASRIVPSYLTAAGVLFSLCALIISGTSAYFDYRQTTKPDAIKIAEIAAFRALLQNIEVNTRALNKDKLLERQPALDVTRPSATDCIPDTQQKRPNCPN